MNVTMNPARQAVIDRMNAGRAQRGQGTLTLRQQHLVCEFTDEEGVIADSDKPLLMQLLQSNSGV